MARLVQAQLEAPYSMIGGPFPTYEEASGFIEHLRITNCIDTAYKNDVN